MPWPPQLSSPEKPRAGHFSSSAKGWVLQTPFSSINTAIQLVTGMPRASNQAYAWAWWVCCSFPGPLSSGPRSNPHTLLISHCHRACVVSPQLSVASQKCQQAAGERHLSPQSEGNPDTSPQQPAQCFQAQAAFSPPAQLVWETRHSLVHPTPPASFLKG